MSYYTKHMIAEKPFRYLGRQMLPGSEFYATEIDASYLVKHGRASESSAHVEPIIPPAAGIDIPRRRGRPPRAAEMPAVETDSIDQSAPPAADE